MAQPSPEHREKRRPKADSKQPAIKRAVEKLGGMEAVDKLEGNTRPADCTYNDGDELLNFVQKEHSLSQNELRVWFRIGGYRVGHLGKKQSECSWVIFLEAR